MRSLTALLLVVPSLLLAACGSSNPSSSTGSGSGASASSDYQRSVQFASCVRSHGVPNFPHPTSNGNGGMKVQSSPGGTFVNGVSVNGPAFQSAMQQCHSYLPNGGQPRQLSAAQKQQALQFSQCMRAHGLTNFPDPVFRSGGGVQIAIRAGTGLDPSSPAFKSAQQACGQPFGKAGVTGRP
jgi:hypothetical protein